MTSHHSAFVPVVALKSSAYHGTPIRPLLNPSVPFLPIANPHGRIVKAVIAQPPSAPDKAPKLSKVEGIKTASNQLRFPLTEELSNSEVFITENAVQVMKFHGSYQQDDRDLRAQTKSRHYQFMLRMKMPSGEFPASLYQVIDDIATHHGNNTLRATTRCAWQIHGILKSDLKTVFSSIMNNGGSCVGACGDISRNVMCTPAPFDSHIYHHARFVSKMVGELFAPQSDAFSEIWLDGEKAASLEYWKNDLDMKKVREVMTYDNGNGIVYQGKEEPIYGETYLPRKFKVGVTVPGDNSIDIYTQDIGVVCVPDNSGRVIGYNLIVGGGMGRSHRKEATFARVGDHLGYVAADKLWEALKAIVATQRDHGNRSVRANARMKYLVDKLGIDSFRGLVETYFGDSFEPYRELKPWKYEDWLGWHEQGDGNSFLGLFLENGRVKNDGDFKLRTALRRITDAYEFDMVVTPNQNLILKNITPNQKDGIESILKEHGVKLASEYNINRRQAMACPALPLCALATTEAERVMPSIVDRVTALLDAKDVRVPVTMRMTGCPNGCARPYMAELGFVGNGPGSYQLWLGGSPNQTRLAWTWLEKMLEPKLEATLAPVLDMYKEKCFEEEAFGDFCNRMGKTEISRYVEFSATGSETSETKAPKTVAVSRGPPKVTVLEAVAGVAEAQVATAGTGDTGAATRAGPESASADNDVVADDDKKRRVVRKPRLNVSDDIMERLKNIGALRDMSASRVADEIIRTYLSGFEDYDLVSEDDYMKGL